MWSNPDTSEFDPGDNDRAKIARERAVPCRLCESAFRRLRLTLRYCAECGRGFCEGEHGTFAGTGRGRCLQCGPSE